MKEKEEGLLVLEFVFEHEMKGVPVTSARGRPEILERLGSYAAEIRVDAGARGNLISDAYLAALAIETGSEWLTTDGDYRVSFVLKRPQPAFLMLLATGMSPVYPCHVSARDMRTRPIGTGPFKLVEFKPNDYIRFQGKKAKIVLREPVENQRHLQGTLAGLENGTVSLDTGAGRVLRFPLNQVERANLKFEW